MMTSASDRLTRDDWKLWLLILGVFGTPILLGVAAGIYHPFLTHLVLIGVFALALVSGFVLDRDGYLANEARDNVLLVGCLGSLFTEVGALIGLLLWGLGMLIRVLF